MSRALPAQTQSTRKMAGSFSAAPSPTPKIIASLLIREHAAAFTQASGVVAGAQVRNVGTVVGNIAHALPAADSAIALAVLGAEVQVRSNQPAVNGDQWRPIASVYLGPGKSGVDSTRELIAAIRLRPTSAFEGVRLRV